MHSYIEQFIFMIEGFHREAMRYSFFFIYLFFFKFQVILFLTLVLTLPTYFKFYCLNQIKQDVPKFLAQSAFIVYINKKKPENESSNLTMFFF